MNPNNEPRQGNDPDTSNDNAEDAGQGAIRNERPDNRASSKNRTDNRAGSNRNRDNRAGSNRN